MLCEICGERKATTTIVVDGVELRVCNFCARFGETVAAEKKKATEPTVKMREEMAEEILPNFGEKIRSAREKMKITREELAKMVGIKENLVEKYEKEKMVPTIKIARKLERVLNIVLVGKPATTAEEKQKGKDLELTLGDIAEVKVKTRAPR